MLKFRPVRPAVLASLGLALALPAGASAATFNGGAITPIGPNAGLAATSLANVAGEGTQVTDVNVVLTNVTHADPADLDIRVVGPQGQSVVLMSDVPDAVGCSMDVTDLDFRFDDAAAGPIPLNVTPLAGGTFKPTDNDVEMVCIGVTDTLIDGIPGIGPTVNNTLLSVFNGTNPNGTWQLFVADDASAGAGDIEGWQLEIKTADSDGDGVPDHLDSCPAQAGNTTNGCPPAARTVRLDARKKIERGRKVQLSGQVDSAQASACQNGQQVVLERRRKKSKPFSQFGTAPSDDAGAYKAKVKVRKTYTYRAHVAASTDCVEAISGSVRVRVTD